MSRARCPVTLMTFSRLCLFLLVCGLVSPARPETPVDASAFAFDDLAGRMGRAEAWYLLAGMTDGLQQASARPEAEGAPTASPLVLQVSTVLTPTVFLPLVAKPESSVMVERRGVWITRYDWTQLGTAAEPEAIDAMVANVDQAGFNTIYFQVRAAGDAYYTPGLEPWASRLSAGPVSETLGLDPGWDPLARMLAVGHAAGLEVHAYINVYTAWQSPPNANYGDLWPRATTPPQMFDRFTYGPTYATHPGVYGLGYAWRQYSGPSAQTPMPLSYNNYLWASPGVDQVNAYVVDVVSDIVRRYPVDGVHLDLVRYAGAAYSYDPSSNAAAGDTASPAREQWQRDRITALVRQVRDVTHALRPEAQVSAAVWPYYVDKWNWGLSEGYSDYYQDSKGWLTSGAVDAIAPMLYGGKSDEAWRWEILMADFIADSGGRPVYPGIGGSYESFDDIAWRIGTARAAGAQGHVIFSYGGLDDRGYWDELAAGPYRVPAAVP